MSEYEKGDLVTVKGRVKAVNDRGNLCIEFAVDNVYDFAWVEPGEIVSRAARPIRFNPGQWFDFGSRVFRYKFLHEDNGEIFCRAEAGDAVIFKRSHMSGLCLAENQDD